MQGIKKNKGLIIEDSYSYFEGQDYF